MASLNNLYISQSYQGLLHFGSNTTSSATLGLIEDGLGNSLGLYLNNNGDLRTTTSISSSLIETTKLIVKDKLELTGSVDILGSVTASNALISNDLIVSGTIYAREIHTVVESSSIIFSSGSNILGDSILDTQTLNGTIIVSGSEQVTGSLTVSNNISSSTISGIGNVTTYSASVQSYINSVSSSISGTITTQSQSFDARLDYLEGPFSTSVDLRLDTLEAFTGSQGLVTTSSFNAYTQSVNNTIATLVTTASFNAYTQSAQTALNNLSQSVSSSIGVTNGRIDVLSSFTGSYATTGSNSFKGTESITGSLNVTGSFGVNGNMVYSGSVRGQVFPITIASQTASMDCSLGNFFTVTLSSGSTRLEATNIQPGETLSLRILNSTSGSQLTGSTSVKFPNGFTYVPTTVAGAIDIVTFLTFDTSSIYSVGANYFL